MDAPDAAQDTGTDAGTAALNAEIERLRARGAATLTPLGWRYIDALARRSAAAPPPVRARLQPRLDQALAACHAAIERARPAAPAVPVRGQPGPLGRLLAECAPPTSRADRPAPMTARADRPAAAPPGAAPGRPDDLRALQRFGSRFERMAVEQRLAGSPAAATAHAGPLNSDGLVSRSLALMREVAPAYLQRFVAHVDALMWLERSVMATPAAPAERGADRPEAAAKPRRRTPAPRRARPPLG